MELAVHNSCAAKGWYRRLGFVVCRWWERTERDWELRGEGLYVPEKPTGEDGKTGGVIMRTAGGVLDGQLRGRSEGRGEARGGISYIIIDDGIEGLRRLNLLEGTRAMARRIYAGERWWVDGTRSHIECLYRPHSQNCPTHFVIAVADREEGGDGRCGAEERGLDEDVTGPSREEGGAGGGHRPQEGGGQEEGQRAGEGPTGGAGGGQIRCMRSLEGQTVEGGQRKRPRNVGQEPAGRLRLPPGPADVDTQVREVEEDTAAEPEGPARRTVMMSIGETLAGLASGAVERIGRMWGAWTAGKRRREGEEQKGEAGEKRQRTGDG